MFTYYTYIRFNYLNNSVNIDQNQFPPEGN